MSYLFWHKSGKQLTDLSLCLQSPRQWIKSSLSSGLKSTAKQVMQEIVRSTGYVGTTISRAFNLPNGVAFTDTEGGDPRWGIQVPIASSTTLKLGSLTMNATHSRTATLGSSGNPLSLISQTDVETINGRKYASAFTASNMTYTDTTPVGRTLLTTLDARERLLSTQLSGLFPLTVTYDNNDRVTSLTQDTRTRTLTYDANGFLSSIIDPLGRKYIFSSDAVGDLLNLTLPDGRLVSYTYDANGDLTSITTPSSITHRFTYTPINRLSSYKPPTLSGTGSTTYTYNLDRNLTTITRPDGKTIKYGYDTAGRLSSITIPTGTITYTYDSNTGNLANAANNIEHIAYSYNGPLAKSAAWTGTVSGSVGRTYNNNFWIASQSVNGANAVNFQDDNDGLLTGAGSLTMSRSSGNGLITGTTLGVTTDSRTYNNFGELVGYTAVGNGTPIYSFNFTRDAEGRITNNTEDIGTINSYVYNYDAAGRLVSVSKNSATDTYSYDSNSNRLNVTTPSGTTNGTYDAQDRLLTYGSASYTYTANGELASQTDGSQKTTYTYDVLGNLTAVTLPNATRITYIIDPENHRVGKKVNGVLNSGFLYDGDRVIAQLNGSNQIISRFVYATGANSPDYMISGGVTYRMFSDQLGSPRVIVNTSTGAIAEEISYDEFGNVISDTNPGFQPFGFAGGLYDQDTRFVRFGARDYNPSIGRWTAKDPIRFAGDDPNLYGYVFDNPVNLVDFNGFQPDDCTCRPPNSARDIIHSEAFKVGVLGTLYNTGNIFRGIYGMWQAALGGNLAGQAGAAIQAYRTISSALSNQADLIDWVRSRTGTPKPCPSRWTQNQFWSQIRQLGLRPSKKKL
jgi:RHS repeat-associated protein